MKIIKNAKYEYEKNNVSEDSGYTKWYDTTETGIIRIIAIVLSYVGLLFFLHTPVFDAMKNSFKVPKGNMESILFFLGSVVIIIFLIPFLWKTFQLAIASRGKLDQKCILRRKGSLTCIYNETLTRGRALVCLIVPGVLFVLIFFVLTILADGVQKTFFLLMLFRIILCATDDIGTLWCLVRKVGKNDIIFGEYKKNTVKEVF